MKHTIDLEFISVKSKTKDTIDIVLELNYEEILKKVFHSKKTLSKRKCTSYTPDSPF